LLSGILGQIMYRLNFKFNLAIRFHRHTLTPECEYSHLSLYKTRRPGGNWPGGQRMPANFGSKPLAGVRDHAPRSRVR
jgi:hypothetical protein